MEGKTRSIESREGDIREEETKGIRRKSPECREEGTLREGIKVEEVRKLEQRLGLKGV